VRTEKLKLSPDVQLWARQPKESNDDFLRFKIYMELGDSRSLEQVVEVWNTTNGPRKQITLSTIKKVSALNRWSDRVGAWDAMQWEEENRRLIKLRKDMLERHRKQGIALQAKGAQIIAAMPVAAVGPGDGLRLIVEGARMESAAIGEPAPVHHGRAGGPDPMDTSDWTPEQRRAHLRELAYELGARSGAGGLVDDDDDD